MRTMRPPGWKIAAVLLVGILAISFGSILVRLALRASGARATPWTSSPKVRAERYASPTLRWRRKATTLG